MTRDNVTTIAVGLTDDEIRKFTDLACGEGISRRELLRQIIERATRANRDRAFYQVGRYRLPNGHRNKILSVGIGVDYAATLKAFAQSKYCSISTVVRRELEKLTPEEIVYRSRLGRGGRRRKPLPVVEIIEEEELTIPCRCGSQMVWRPTRQDYFCCNCRAVMPVAHDATMNLNLYQGLKQG